MKWGTKKLTRKILSKFLESHASDKYTLDIGCERSPYSKLFPNRVGLDVNDGPDVDVVGDAHELPFEDNTFDVVLCTEVLEHLHSPHIAAQEMMRVLKPGGKLVLTTRFMFPIHGAPVDYFRYTPYGLKKLFEGLDGIEITREANITQFMAIMCQRIAYQGKVRFGKLGRGFFLLLAQILWRMPDVAPVEYSDTGKQVEAEWGVMTTGYYITGFKPKS